MRLHIILASTLALTACSTGRVVGDGETYEQFQIIGSIREGDLETITTNVGQLEMSSVQSPISITVLERRLVMCRVGEPKVAGHDIELYCTGADWEVRKITAWKAKK